MSDEVRQIDPDDAEKQRKSNGGKMLGGITGKGFMPGESGNPGGRAKGRTVLSRVREILEDEAEGQAVAVAYVGAMKCGSFQHLKEVIDREEGKVPDRVANADGSNLEQYDLSRLSLDELLTIRAAQQKAAVQPPEVGSGDLPSEPDTIQQGGVDGSGADDAA
jgi:hypothetical protein